MSTLYSRLKSQHKNKLDNTYLKGIAGVVIDDLQKREYILDLRYKTVLYLYCDILDMTDPSFTNIHNLFEEQED